MKFLYALILILLAIAAALLHKHKVQSFRNQFASGGELRSPVQSFFVHGMSEEHYLSIGGITYRQVRGSEPFYLDVTQIQSIVFVTGKVDRKSQIHVLNKQSSLGEVFDGGPEDFGWDIGSDRKAEEPWTDFVKHADSHEIVLIHNYGGFGYEIAASMSSGRLSIRDVKTP